MSNSHPVKPRQVEVLGIHPRFARLLLVRIDLDRPTTEEWRARFADALRTSSRKPIFPPELKDQAVIITLPDDQLEAEVALVEHCIRAANAACEAAAAAALLVADAAGVDGAASRLDAARARARELSEGLARKVAGPAPT